MPGLIASGCAQPIPMCYATPVVANADPYPVQGSVLSIVSAWTGMSLAYSYQWYRGASTEIGTNAATYTVVVADVGSTLKCKVTATARNTQWGAKALTSVATGKAVGQKYGTVAATEAAIEDATFGGTVT